MNKLAIAFVAITFASVASKAAEPEINPSHIDVLCHTLLQFKGSGR